MQSNPQIQNIPQIQAVPNPSPTRTSRKRKSPPVNIEPEPHTLQHMVPMSAIPPQYQYNTDFSPAGMPPPPNMEMPQNDAESAAGGRVLSTSKRAEQNRKAQRAFRERRDQHVKNLESRSLLLEAALASADEANRRWEECRALLDQLRVENAALRAALTQQAQLPIAPPPPSHIIDDTGADHAAAEAKHHLGDILKEQ